jgi:CheY-like chemotaxis protein
VKILIIEDFEGDIALLEARLEAIGAEVVVAKSAVDGLRLARAERPGLIVTDLNLGRGMEEGIEMVAAMRKDPAIAHIPLIIHSVFVSAPGDVKEATSLADGILPKPYRFVDLAAIVEKMRT